MTGSSSNGHRLRLLVALASYGDKNVPFLRQVIRRYRSMDLEVHVVVLSNTPKDLDGEAEVVVGLPAKNPWSLPFGHKRIFAERVEQYDLFAYSEDDIGVTESNIRAFLRLTPALRDDEIAGFLHYEQDPNGREWMVCAHRHFHWKPDSVRQRGDHLVAQFTNEHSAFYLLTQAQLKRAIASGGFLKAPYEGQYDMLCTAATDPYTSCGFQKVICISALKDFLVHHLPNKYIAELDVSLEMFEQQVQTLRRIREGRHPASSLFGLQSKFWHFWWQKSYREKPAQELLELVPAQAREILSIGCGSGDTEARLQERGAKVTALPLDSVIGAVAERRGIPVVYGSWEESLRALRDRRFDCVVMTDLLHLVRDPDRLARQCAGWVAQNGTLVLGGPNFDRAPWLLKRKFGSSEFRKLNHFERSGISLIGPRRLAKILAAAGLRTCAVHWLHHDFTAGPIPRLALGRFTAQDWLLQARRP